MSKKSDLELLKTIILSDSDLNPAKIINVRGGESGLDHTELTTQSENEKELGIVTVHRIYSGEV
jgi:hypothetical protein